MRPQDRARSDDAGDCDIAVTAAAASWFSIYDSVVYRALRLCKIAVLEMIFEGDVVLII